MACERCPCGKKIYRTWQHALNDAKRVIDKSSKTSGRVKPYHCEYSNLHIGHNWDQRTKHRGTDK